MEMQSSSEQNNTNYRQMNDNGDDSKFIWHIISIISWIIFILTIWYSYNIRYFFWTLFGNYIDNALEYSHQIYYIPIQMDMAWLNIFIFLISVIGFGLYLFYTTIKMNQNLYNGMLSNLSKFHFIPLLFISALYIVAGHDFSTDNLFKHIRTLLIFDIIFTILGLAGLIFIYVTMDLQTEWYFVFTIKKGVFSTFIVLLWYNLFNVIIYLKSVDYIIKDDLEDDSFYNFYKGTGISFSIIIGLGSLAFAFFFRDVMAAFVNFLIYVGFVLYFFNKSKNQMTEIKEDFNGYADGIIDIIMMAISFGFIPFLIFFYKKAIFN